MWRCSTGFNGATAFQPWKQSLGTRRTNTRSRFNGATAFQPWKHEGLCDEKGLPTDASMGPRPFSRGNFTQDGQILEVQPRFNGATAFQPWKREIRKG